MGVSWPWPSPRGSGPPSATDPGAIASWTDCPVDCSTTTGVPPRPWPRSVAWSRPAGLKPSSGSEPTGPVQPGRDLDLTGSTCLMVTLTRGASRASLISRPSLTCRTWSSCWLPTDRSPCRRTPMPGPPLTDTYARRRPASLPTTRRAPFPIRVPSPSCSVPSPGSRPSAGSGPFPRRWRWLGPSASRSTFWTCWTSRARMPGATWWAPHWPVAVAVAVTVVLVAVAVAATVSVTSPGW